MNTINIVHCADLHLGMHYCSLKEKSSSRNSELLNTFNRIISICRENNTDILLIAGDLFDRCQMGAFEVLEVINIMKSLENTRVFIAPGNHDFYNMNSPYELYEWPDNVYVFKEEPQTIYIKELNATVTGAAFTARHHEESFIKTLNELPDDTINLGVFHGEIVNYAGQESTYAPFFPKDLNGKGFDYVALGHIHTATPILKEKDTTYAYCGTPDGHGFDETGNKGIYVGSVQKKRADLEFVLTGERRFWKLSIDISECGTNQEVAERIRNTLLDEFGEYEKNFYDIALVGKLSGSLRLDVEAISAFLFEIHYLQFRDETYVAKDLLALSKEKSVRGIFVANMSTLIKQYEDEGREDMKATCEKALDLCLKAFREKK